MTDQSRAEFEALRLALDAYDARIKDRGIYDAPTQIWALAGAARALLAATQSAQAAQAQGEAAASEPAAQVETLKFAWTRDPESGEVLSAPAAQQPAALDARAGQEGGEMQAWCSCCEARTASSFRLCHDSKTGEPFEDLCCDVCHFVIATVTNRLSAPARAPEPVSDEPSEAQIACGAHVLSEWLNDNAPIGERRYREPAKAAFVAMSALLLKEAGHGSPT